MRKLLILSLTLVFLACNNDSSDDDSQKTGSNGKKEDAKSSEKDESSGSSSKSGSKSGDSVKTGSASENSSDDESASNDAPNSGSQGSPAMGTQLIPGLDVSWPAAEEGLATEKINDAPTFHVTRPADLKSLKKSMPVVVWANGGCLRSDFSWVPLFNRWAKAGYIVLSLTGMGADGDLFSMLGFTSSTEHTQMIDWVVAQNEEGPYAGKLDLDHIVIAGNSCGGVTALETASQDDRPAAVFVLSGSSAVGSVDTSVMGKITVPVGYIVGGAEDIAGANAKGDYEAMQEGLPAMIVHRRTGDHPTVSTDPMILPEDAEISLNWMELALFGKQKAYDALTSEDVCEVCTPGDWTLESKNLKSLLKK